MPYIKNTYNGLNLECNERMQISIFTYILLLFLRLFIID